MKIVLRMFLVPLLVSCAIAPKSPKEKFVAAPNSIDGWIGTATIEDYVIALPPYAYHEASTEDFAAQVRNARATEKENQGKGNDYLFVGGDGSWPSKGFTLDRNSKALKIRIYNWEPGTTDYTETMRRVYGGWMRGSRLEIKTTEQHGGTNSVALPASS